MNTNKWILACSAVALTAAFWWYAKQDMDVPPSGTEVAATAVQSTLVAEAATAPASTQIAPPTKRIAPPTFAANIDDYVDWQRELIGSLIALNDADSIMTAALILHALNGEDPVERRNVSALLIRAHAAAPSDRAIASVGLRVCRSMTGCPAARFEHDVRNMDARNALGPMEEIAGRLEKGNSAQKTEALIHLADLRLNLYYGEVASRVARSISSAPTTPRFAPPSGDLGRMQNELALRAVDAIEVPSYLAVGPACQTNNQSDNWRNRMPCNAIVRDLSRAELIELQRLGMEIEAASGDGRRKRPSDITDAEAYLNWMGTTKGNNPPSAAQWIALLAQNRTELAATRAWLESKGVTPPRVPLWLERAR